MEDPNLPVMQMLQDFEEFERGFLQPYVPKSADLACQPEDRVSWLEQMEKHFVDTQFSQSLFHYSDSKPQTASNLIPDDLSWNFTLPNLVDDVPEIPLLVVQTDNLYDPVSLDDLPLFDTSLLPCFDNDGVPTSPYLEKDKTVYTDKADNKYDELDAMKLTDNQTMLQEAMDRERGGCIENMKGGKVCCKGKCWAYIENRLRQLDKVPRGRRKKGSELSPEVRELCKERQKIKNRISAAECYRKEKAHIHDQEVRVSKLKEENKIRRNLIKFLESGVQRRRKCSIGRTMSGPL